MRHGSDKYNVNKRDADKRDDCANSKHERSIRRRDSLAWQPEASARLKKWHKNNHCKKIRPSSVSRNRKHSHQERSHQHKQQTGHERWPQNLEQVVEDRPSNRTQCLCRKLEFVRVWLIQRIVPLSGTVKASLYSIGFELPDRRNSVDLGDGFRVKRHSDRSGIICAVRLYLSTAPDSIRNGNTHTGL